jgi:hypothetical protein
VACEKTANFEPSILESPTTTTTTHPRFFHTHAHVSHAPHHGDKTRRSQTAARQERLHGRKTEPNVSLYLRLLFLFPCLTCCHSLYVRQLNDKLPKEDLRRSLYILFSTYGTVLDVVALKTTKMRGQAHVVYRDTQSAAIALRNLNGMEFFGRPMVRSNFLFTLPDLGRR